MATVSSGAWDFQAIHGEKFQDESRTTEEHRNELAECLSLDSDFSGRFHCGNGPLTRCQMQTLCLA
jgi:hypothetical protein